MRNEYKVLSDAEKEAMRRIKDAGLNFHNELVLLFGRASGVNGQWPSREISIAATKIEEAVMWAVKHLTA